MIRDGPSAAPPLLLVHGSGAGSATWEPVVPALAAHRHVIRVDLPGCGQSPPVSSYDVPGQAARVAGVLDGLGLRSVTVAGHSSGGYVATALAESRPELVGSLALISTGPDLAAFRPQPLILRLLLGPVFGPLLWRARTDSLIRRAILATCAHPSSRTSRPAAATSSAPASAVALRPVSIPDAMVAELRGITYRSMSAVLRANTDYLAERGIPDRLAALGRTALVIFGAADPRWAPSSAHRYPTSRVELLPGVGHLPMLEDPASTAELLLSAD
ncbi:alpha/beta hydrolase [Actinoplanes sichuanensis]|nr:alpha/beta hydrolase [Actinoplanes sichuanensis]